MARLCFERVLLKIAKMETNLAVLLILFSSIKMHISCCFVGF